jgi:hypothetical protein
VENLSNKAPAPSIPTEGKKMKIWTRYLPGPTKVVDFLPVPVGLVPLGSQLVSFRKAAGA